MPPDYPDDDNGLALQRMAAAGVDLSSPRIVDFEHCFPSESAAWGFFDEVHTTVTKARIYEPDPEDGSGWEVQCSQRMIPTHRAITDTENRLARIAHKYGGHPDGWGSLSNPDGSPAA